MMKLAQLEVSVKTNELGQREAETYKWLGDSPYVDISWRYLVDDIDFPKSEIQIGPYKLIKVEDKPEIDGARYVRKDKLGRLRVFLYKTTRWLDLIYRRLILTLVVWHLAEYHGYMLPTWRDIKILKRLSK